MDVDEPTLELWRHEWIDQIESARLLRLTDDRDQSPNRRSSVTSTATLRRKSQSRESTVTMRGISEMPGSRFSAADAMDIDLQEKEGLKAASNRPTLIVATDFGTTFSSVAFAVRGEGIRPSIKMIANYPNDPLTKQGRPSLEVPTESWYPNASQITEMSLDMDMISADEERPDDPYGVPDLLGDEDEEEVGHFVDDPFQDNVHDPLPVQNASQNFIWGYGIQSCTAPDMDRSQFDRIARSKLLLDTSPNTEKVRQELRPVIRRLKRRKIINKERDVVADYLTQLFMHAKEQISNHHGISYSTVEHVLCVPIVWSAGALRKMQRAMETALQNSDFGTIDDLFLVSEPEAAAAYVLGKSNEVNRGEAFLILDAGGGTVDATTYMVDKEYPLRLSKELVPPKGCLHGSSYLNEDFRKHLLGRLEHERNVEQNGYTIEGIVDTAVIQFENRTKRTLDVNNFRTPMQRILIQGLEADEEKRFAKNGVLVTRNDFSSIFMPRLREIRTLMRRQLSDAKEAGFRVQKVVLTGGFSASPSLRNYLKEELRIITRRFGYQIRLIESVDAGDLETAVAHGALLRALNKEDGPARITRSSYGFLVTEPYKEYPAHEGVRPSIDRIDGYKYVEDTIDWLVKVGDEIPPQREYPITVYHVFSATRTTFPCEQLLYVSDTSTESHYRRTHDKNKGAEVAGKIITDMSFLVTEGLIKPIDPEPGYAGKRHYKIEFELVMIIDGRNLRYEARWPAGGEVQSRGQISIAAAFLPGTN